MASVGCSCCSCASHIYIGKSLDRLERSTQELIPSSLLMLDSNRMYYLINVHDYGGGDTTNKFVAKCDRAEGLTSAIASGLKEGCDVFNEGCLWMVARLVGCSVKWTESGVFALDRPTTIKHLGEVLTQIDQTEGLMKYFEKCEPHYRDIFVLINDTGGVLDRLEAAGVYLRF